MPVLKPTIDNKNTTSACGGLPYYLAMNLFTKHRLQRPWIEYLLLTLLFGLVLSLRIRSALFRLPPDPGYYMFDDARHASFWKSVFVSFNSV